MRSLTQLLTLLLVFISFSSSAQVDKSKYNLLWEISGNGLEQPSYLFGTIHLKDKRAFEFSDSLLYALEDCDAFATEVHPDTAFLFYTKKRYQRDTTDFLSKMLSPEAYKRMKEQLKAKEGISLDSLENKDPHFLRSLFRPAPPVRPDDKDLFVDFYLYRIARRLGKPTFGLERLEDRQKMVDIFFEDFEEKPSTIKLPPAIEKTINESHLESLVEIYQKGDINLIDQRINRFPNDSAYHDATLVHRNIIMANNIDTIIQKNSLFATMGVAHLPGTDGVIALLKQKGYSMRPVTATFTGQAEKFEIKEKKALWNTYEEDYHKFKIDLPGSPYVWEYERLGRRFFSHYLFYHDAIEKIRYGVKVNSGYWDKSNSIDSFLINSIKENIFWYKKDIEIKDTKLIEINGNQGMSFTAEGDSTFNIGKIIYNGSAVYLIYAQRDDNQLGHSDINRFFDSFQIEKPKSFGWKKFNSKFGAFSITTPYPPDSSSINLPVPDVDGNMYNIDLHLFTVKDFENGHLYVLRYNDIGEGLYIENDSFAFALALADFKTKMGEPDTLFTVYQDGYEGKEIVYAKGQFLLRIKYIIRGSRVYLLMGQNLKEQKNTSSLDEFFNSFEFTPFNHSPLEKHLFEEESFSAHYPKKPVTLRDTSSLFDYPSETSFSAYAEDHNTGITYFVNKTKFSPYFQVDTLEKYLEEIIEIDSNDSILINKNIEINGSPGKYLKYHSQATNCILHYYGIIRGFEMFEAYLYAPKEMKDNEVLTFLNSLQLFGDIPEIDMTTKKISFIMNDFYSNDSTTAEKAEYALNNHPLIKEELPYIYKALGQEYENDTMLYNSTISMLADLLIEVNDSNTVDSLVYHYHLFPNNNIRKMALLSALGDKRLPRGLNEFIPLFEKYEPDSTTSIYNLNNFIYPFRDSLKLLVDNFDLVFLKYKSDTLWGNSILSLFQDLVSNDSIDYSVIKKNTPYFIEKIKSIIQKENLLQKDSVSVFDDYGEFFNLISICRKLDLQPSDIDYFKSILPIKNHWLCAEIVRVLISKNQKIHNRYWSYINENPSAKFFLLEKLNNDGLLKKAPKKWLTNKTIALLRYHYGTFEDYIEIKIEDFQVIKKFKFTYKEKEHQVYVIKYQYPGEKGNYYGLASQPVNEFDFATNFFDASYEPLEDKDVDEFIEAKLEWYRQDDLKRKKNNE